MTTLDELTPTTLTDVEVREVTLAYAHAVKGDFIRMWRTINQLRPQAAEDALLACEVLRATLARRAYGRGRPTPPLVAAAVLTPDDPRLPGGAA